MSKKPKKTTGELVRAARVAAGLSLAVCAVRAGMSPTGLGNVERGVSVPSVDTLSRVATVLGVPVGDLIGEAAPAA